MFISQGVVVKPGKRQAKAPRTASLNLAHHRTATKTAGAQLKLPGRRGQKPKNVARFRRCAAMHFDDFFTFFFEKVVAGTNKA